MNQFELEFPNSFLKCTLEYPKLLLTLLDREQETIFKSYYTLGKLPPILESRFKNIKDVFQYLKSLSKGRYSGNGTLQFEGNFKTANKIIRFNLNPVSNEVQNEGGSLAISLLRKIQDMHRNEKKMKERLEEEKMQNQVMKRKMALCNPIIQQRKPIPTMEKKTKEPQRRKKKGGKPQKANLHYNGKRVTSEELIANVLRQKKPEKVRKRTLLVKSKSQFKVTEAQPEKMKKIKEYEDRIEQEQKKKKQYLLKSKREFLAKNKAEEGALSQKEIKTQKMVDQGNASKLFEGQPLQKQEENLLSQSEGLMQMISEEKSVNPERLKMRSKINQIQEQVKMSELLPSQIVKEEKIVKDENIIKDDFSKGNPSNPFNYEGEFIDVDSQNNGLVKEEEYQIMLEQKNMKDKVKLENAKKERQRKKQQRLQQDRKRYEQFFMPKMKQYKQEEDDSIESETQFYLNYSKKSKKLPQVKVEEESKEQFEEKQKQVQNTDLKKRNEFLKVKIEQFEKSKQKYPA